MIICSLVAKESLSAVCDETLNSACDQMTLQCYGDKFILDIRLGALFRTVFIDQTFFGQFSMYGTIASKNR